MTEYPLPPAALTITVDDPKTHTFRVDLRLENTLSPSRVTIPSWTPGSYLMREFARQVHSFCAPGSHRVRKVEKGTWEVFHDGSLHVSYLVNAQERGIRTPYLDDEFGFCIGPNVFVHAEGELDRAVTLETRLPAGWTTFSSDLDGFVGTELRFESVDDLYDSALLFGRPDKEVVVHHFEACETPHALAVVGRGELDTERVIGETIKIIEAAARLVNGDDAPALPYDRYLFILVFTGNYRGGLEHANSCAIAYPRLRYATGDDHVDLLMLIAHEHFHVWNIKRVRTDVLGPFDYANENYTRDLWIGEGWTSYYQHHLALRAGVIDADTFVGYMAKRTSTHERKPGRHVQSLDESSFDAWIKLYRRDANSPNTTISYYLKGSLAACLLDLEIRRRSADKLALDDVFRHLWREFAVHGDGYPEGTMQAQVEAVVGGDFSDWFDRVIGGTEPLEWESALAHVGLRRVEVREGNTSWIGAKLDGTKLTTVFDHGPAQLAGLMAGDELVALDGLRLARGKLSARLRHRKVGEVVEVAFFRDHELRFVTLTLAEAPPSSVRFEDVDDPSPAQLASRAAWLEGDPES